MSPGLFWKTVDISNCWMRKPNPWKKPCQMSRLCVACCRFVPGAKKIWDEDGYWDQLESYLTKHSEAAFTHSICPECADKSFEELQGFIDKNRPKEEKHSSK